MSPESHGQVRAIHRETEMLNHAFESTDDLGFYASLSGLVDKEVDGDLFTAEHYAALTNIVQSKPESYDPKSLEKAAPFYDLAKKALKLLVTKEEYLDYAQQQIRGATSLDDLAERCKKLPGLVTSDGQLIVGHWLSELVIRVVDKYIKTEKVDLAGRPVDFVNVMDLKQFLKVKLPELDITLNPDSQPDVYIPRTAGLRDTFENLLKKSFSRTTQ